MTLLLLSLRTQRLFIASWTVLLVVLAGGTKGAYQSTYPTAAQRLEAVESARLDAASTLLYGVFERPGTPAQMFVWEMGAFLTILAGVMAVLLAVSLTRSAEDDGTLEILRVTGLPAGAAIRTAATVLAIVAALLAGGCTLAVALAPGRTDGVTWPGAVAFGAVVGMTFLLVGLLTVALAQVASSAPGARTLGVAALAVAFAVRATADSQHVDWLNWLTPLGLRATVQPFTDDRWTALAAALVACAGLLCAGTVLSARREYRAGLLPSRAARDSRLRVRTVVGLIARLDRRSVVVWSTAMGCMGAGLCALGSNAVEMAGRGALDDGLLGSQLTGDVRSAYLRYTATIIAIVVSVLGVQSVLAAHREETSGLTDVVLTTGLRRWSPLAGRFVASAGATLIVLLVTATLTALAAIGVLGGADTGERAFVYVLGQWFPVIVFAGLAALVAGLVPRLSGLAWLPLAGSAVLAILGELLSAPDWVQRLDVYQHAPDPAVGFTFLPLLALLLLAVGTALVGARGVSRRDIGRA
jgi:ABC-2 type transport system permease protein